ncbi:HAMP domain-containing histidine kinase [Komarekiella sp. 'clone 1']|uniref:histidine kinase n=1 Tax=Komarekiella delphini-convector SJRDD-AB1 TaxID=2593771 RepID=A0AA40SWC2_9NOST|nr:ATP-binding protein [Komarekiella delphini-convector]MBD6616165.1 HAMP domain-containing histidine kinase [Komarekiella delphini-convector SJRDD-AB1]
MKAKLNLNEININYWLRCFLPKLALGPSQVVAATVLLTLLLFVPQAWIAWQASRKFNSIIKNELRLQNLSDKITYFDEVLTMSARMNAATGDSGWEQRYRLFEPQLDAAIKESIKLAPQAYTSEDAKNTDAANQRLVTMEYQSFDLVRSGEKEAAQALLSSREYETEKQKYAAGVTSRNRSISLQLQHKVADYHKQLLWSTFASVVSLVMLIPAWLSVLHLLQSYLRARKIAQAALEKTNQELETIVEKRTQELSKKNMQLQQTLQELQKTQVQLIQTEKMSSLGQMIAGIAHEMNNPVSFVYGNLVHTQKYTYDLLKLVELYQQNYPNPPQSIQAEIEATDLDFLSQDFAQLLKSMSIGMQRIQEIVQSLRTFSRLDEAEVKKVDIHQGIDSTLMILQHRLRATHEHPEISVIKEYGLLPPVECYPGQLNQVFMNILSNAIDALGDRYLQPTPDTINSNPSFIRIYTVVIAESWVEIHIIDNGSGIPDKILSKLFDPFFTTKPVGKGKGLGLSISYQIVVNKHAGRLYCNSTLGQGTEFVIEIPIAQLQAAHKI